MAGYSDDSVFAGIQSTSGKPPKVYSVQELVRKQPQTLPERYIRSEEERPSRFDSSSHLDVPIIDLAAFLDNGESKQHEMSKLNKACEEWGFFQVVNHGIPHDLLSNIRRVVKEFFKLPLEEKKRYAPQPGDVQGYGQMFVVSEDQKLDWHDLLALSLMPHKIRNINLWPTHPIDFRDTMDNYVEEIQKLARRLLILLAENLGLKGDYFNDNFGETLQLMRMNYYPPCPRPDLTMGLSSHSDGGGITLLLQDEDTQGLHIRKNNQWISVKPIPNALVINIADMIEVMTNGRYKSVEHRAVTNQDKERLSIAIFYNPSLHGEVFTAPDLLKNATNTCRFRSFRQADYIRYHLGKKLGGKSLLYEFAGIEQCP